MGSAAPVPFNPEYTAIAVAYKNRTLIADGVLPRVPVGKEEFKYRKYALGELFTLPDTKIGRKSTANIVELGGTETTAATQDWGLDDLVPHSDIENAPEGHDPLAVATEFLTNLVLLDREKRTADLVFAAAQYAAANKVQLAGNDQWNVDDVASDPIADITTGLDACIMRPNIMVIGRAAFTKLATHKKIIQAVYGSAQTGGIARREQIRDLFELEEVLVGESFLNTAKKGQAASMARVWGKHCALIYRDKLADPQRGTTFGFTGQFGSRVAWTEFDRKIGLKGAHQLRVGESVKEVITANDLGYFIQDAVA